MDANTKIPTEQRRRLIHRLVQEQGAAATDELANRFDVSYMTIWRDIGALDQAGKVQRVRGGVLRLEQEGGDRVAEPPYRSKRDLNVGQKNAIARYAATHFVDDQDILILEAGTTAAAMVKHLTQQGLTVITNGVETIYAAAPLVPQLTVMSCGGILRDRSHTFVGPHAERFFHDVRARTLFLGATGLTMDDGITDPNPLEIEIKRAMAASADRIVLLMDGSKFGVRSLAPVLPLEEIHMLITDDSAPVEMIRLLETRGVNVRVVAVK